MSFFIKFKLQGKLALIIALVLSGCTVQKMPLKDGAQVSSVSVSENIVAPEEIYFVGKGAAFGALGAMANVSSAEKFKRFAVENGVDIKEIVGRSFREKLQAAKKFPVEKDAKNIIHLKIKVYGISNTSMLSDDYIPVLLVQSEMINEKNEVIWKGGYYLQPLGNPVAPVSLEKMQEDPSLLGKLWEEAADVVSEKTIEQL